MIKWPLIYIFFLIMNMALASSKKPSSIKRCLENSFKELDSKHNDILIDGHYKLLDEEALRTGKIINRPKDFAAMTKSDGLYVYLIDENDNLIIGPRILEDVVERGGSRYLGNHPSLLYQLRDSLSLKTLPKYKIAGEFRMLHGDMVLINNKAGRFRRPTLTPAIESFQDHGIQIPHNVKKINLKQEEIKSDMHYEEATQARLQIKIKRDPELKDFYLRIKDMHRKLSQLFPGEHLHTVNTQKVKNAAIKHGSTIEEAEEIALQMSYLQNDKNGEYFLLSRDIEDKTASALSLYQGQIDLIEAAVIEDKAKGIRPTKEFLDLLEENKQKIANYDDSIHRRTVKKVLDTTQVFLDSLKRNKAIIDNSDLLPKGFPFSGKSERVTPTKVFKKGNFPSDGKYIYFYDNNNELVISYKYNKRSNSEFSSRPFNSFEAAYKSHIQTGGAKGPIRQYGEIKIIAGDITYLSNSSTDYKINENIYNDLVSKKLINKKNEPIINDDGINTTGERLLRESDSKRRIMYYEADPVGRNHIIDLAGLIHEFDTKMVQHGIILDEISDSLHFEKFKDLYYQYKYNFDGDLDIHYESFFKEVDGHQKAYHRGEISLKQFKFLGLNANKRNYKEFEDILEEARQVLDDIDIMGDTKYTIGAQEALRVGDLVTNAKHIEGQKDGLYIYLIDENDNFIHSPRFLMDKIMDEDGRFLSTHPALLYQLKKSLNLNKLPKVKAAGEYRVLHNKVTLINNKSGRLRFKGTKEAEEKFKKFGIDIDNKIKLQDYSKKEYAQDHLEELKQVEIMKRIESDPTIKSMHQRLLSIHRVLAKRFPGELNSSIQSIPHFYNILDNNPELESAMIQLTQVMKTLTVDKNGDYFILTKEVIQAYRKDAIKHRRNREILKFHLNKQIKEERLTTSEASKILQSLDDKILALNETPFLEQFDAKLSEMEYLQDQLLGGFSPPTIQSLDSLKDLPYARPIHAIDNVPISINQILPDGDYLYIKDAKGNTITAPILNKKQGLTKINSHKGIAKTYLRQQKELRVQHFGELKIEGGKLVNIKSSKKTTDIGNEVERTFHNPASSDLLSTDNNNITDAKLFEIHRYIDRDPYGIHLVEEVHRRIKEIDSLKLSNQLQQELADIKKFLKYKYSLNHKIKGREIVYKEQFLEPLIKTDKHFYTLGIANPDISTDAIKETMSQKYQEMEVMLKKIDQILESVR